MKLLSSNLLPSVSLSSFNVNTILNFAISSLKYAAYAVIFLSALWLVAILVLKLIDLWHQLKQNSVFLEITPPLITEIHSVSTAQLFSLIEGLVRQRSLPDKLLFRKSSCSFEIVSSKETGIRYILCLPTNVADVFEKNLRAYLPGIKVKEISDYLPSEIQQSHVRISEFKLSRHFSLPLNEQTDLEKHDPLAYLTGNMTQMKAGELMTLQIIIRPIGGRKHNEVAKIKIMGQNPNNNSRSWYILRLFTSIVESVIRIAMIPLLFLAEFAGGHPAEPLPKSIENNKQTVDPEHSELIKSKLNQPLFETTIRTFLLMDKDHISSRDKGLRSSFASFFHTCGQSVIPKRKYPFNIFRQLNWQRFRLRLSGTPAILSASEMGALYHFPFTANTHTEDLIRVRSKELPAPLVLKNNNDLDVVFGKNTFGNTITDVGLTDDDRSRHVYLIGQTGSGKSTIIYHMASDDINKGRGLAVVDPHGDLAEGLLDTISDERIDDVIYLNPFDIKHPVGINLLELNTNLEEDELELEKELVCESIVSIFRRVFFKDENTDAHRIEYILRNTIYTAFVVPDRTIFTVYELLNDQNFRKQAIKNLDDENLIKFWKNEFGKAGDYQHVKMVSGVTSKVGRFLFSPIAKRILEQPKSTINFDDILNNKKVLLCNLAEGKLGEDTSMLLGATVIAKIHQAAVRRARISSTDRIPFYLFVDEFQNFATSSFTKLLSGGRKFGLRITIAEQSTAQQDNKNVTNVVLANTGTVICFRTASPVDEELMLSQFAPQVVQGDIGNLPRYRFYMRLAAIEPEAPFSGETIPIITQKDPKKVESIVEASRKNYAIVYEKKIKKTMFVPPESKPEKTKPNDQETIEILS